MTTTKDRAVPVQAGLVPAGYVPPRVNLLPPETYTAQALGRLKRTLVLALVLVLVVCGAVYALMAVRLSAQQDALADAEAETLRLTAAQQQYAEVPVVLTRLSQLEQARESGMSTETLWQDYLGYVFAVMPQGVKVASLTVTGATPMLAPAAVTDPLQGESVTRVDFTAVSDTVPNVAAWRDSLDSIPGFQDAWVSVVTVGEDEETSTSRFEMSVSVQVTDEAYANRFVPVEGEG